MALCNNTRTPSYDCKLCLSTLSITYFDIQTFSSFQIEEHSQCKYDSASIYDGGDTNAPLVGIFCGVTAPPMFMSSTNQLFLTFSSDASVSRQGFEAHYSSGILCGGRLTAESSPGHIYSHATFSDSKYGKSQDCWWRISARSRHRGVRIQFNSFTLEAEERCQYDYVEIYDGSEPVQHRLFGRYCGDQIPETVTSTGGLLHIQVLFTFFVFAPTSVHDYHC
ncbi:unnamed protein product [Cylicostephanus goldi]|uniref:CUB domain-containing protein n=1 Tax=Cylicostephanus goldi TaxID=71465 RepID=A0A3P6TT27_CYLGO|nr:unnamed protein product [Cylicostephanus goldi]